MTQTNAATQPQQSEGFAAFWLPLIVVALVFAAMAVMQSRDNRSTAADTQNLSITSMRVIPDPASSDNQPRENRHNSRALIAQRY